MRPSSASVAQQLAHPADALGVQAVDRLVEQQDVGVAEQRGRDAEPLAHAEREAAHPVVGDGLETDQLDHLVDPARRAAGCSGRGRAGGGRRCARGAGRRGRSARRPGASARRARGRAGRAPSPSRRSAGPAPGRSASSSSCPSRWARGSRSPGRVDRDGQVVDGDAGAVPLGQPASSITRSAWPPAARPAREDAPGQDPLCAASRSCWISCLLRSSRRNVTTSSPPAMLSSAVYQNQPSQSA